MVTCERWLKDFLNENGRANCDVVRLEAKWLGYRRAELKLAREALGVKTYHDPAGAWYWYLPEGGQISV